MPAKAADGASTTDSPILALHTEVFSGNSALLNPDGKGDSAAISLTQDNPFHESGVHGMLQNVDAASKAVRSSLAQLFLIEALTRKIYHLPKQQVLQHPWAVS